MWKCSCGIVNNGLNKRCAGIGQAIIKYPGEHKPVTENAYDIVERWVLYERPMRWLNEVLSKLEVKMTDSENLFAKFFNHEALLVKDMDAPTLRAHEEELAAVAFEAKARLSAIDKHKRERNAKLKTEQKEWLVSPEHVDHLVTDAINVVEARKKRLSKADKLNEALKKMPWLDDKTRQEMMKNVEKRATESQMNLVTFVSKKVEERKAEEKELAEEKKEEITSEPAKKADWSFLKK